jgi:hypothetical protein
MYENSDFAMKINEIYIELSGNSQRSVNKYCESESDGKIDGFAAGYCKCRGGGVAITMWCSKSCKYNIAHVQIPYFGKLSRIILKAF